MAKLAFCDYHNMVAILEKTEHNTDFYQIVDFLEASHIRYALTISPIVYVSHIRQFWSTARIETTNQETKFFATIHGKPRTISESSLRRHVNLNDEEGISSLLDIELFENLSLMGYNILPIQSNIATAVVCLATNMVYNFSKMIFDGMELHSPQHDSPPPSHRTIIFKPLPQALTETLTHRKYTRRAIRIAQLKALSPAADEPASLSRDDRQGEAFPTATILDGCQNQRSRPGNIWIKGKSQVSRGQRKKKCRAYLRGCSNYRGIKDIEEDLGADKSTKLGSNDTKEMVNVLSSMEAANILLSGSAAAIVSPADVLPPAGVPTVSGSFPTVSVIFTTASVVIPYTRWSRGITIGLSQPMRTPILRAKDKSKEKMIETEVPKKRKLQEQIDAQIARLYAEEELKIMIEGLDRSNKVIAKHLSEYEQAEADLSVKEKIELIRELIKYQDHHANILKYQAQQSKPLLKKEQKEFYMSVLRSHAGWKTKHFRGMTLEQIKEKFIPVWKQYEDFVPISSKEESKRVKRQGLKIDQGSSKRMKISEGVSKEELKGMMQLVPLEEVYIEALQPTRNKEKELWVELKRLFEPNFEDQLWTHHQEFMHDPLDWKLYDTCGIHHVSTKDQEIFMLVEKDYPLRKGLPTVMISNKLQHQVLERIVGNKMLQGIPTASYDDPTASTLCHY
nr:hypothetical protein [Tanacetum cinerariifolium]